nr:MAG TPA: hypothetical protein [Caudoviricetes sp.]
MVLYPLFCRIRGGKTIKNGINPLFFVLIRGVNVPLFY